MKQVALTVFAWTSLLAQANQEPEFVALKRQVAAQQERLRAQRAQLQLLRNEFAEIQQRFQLLASNSSTVPPPAPTPPKPPVPVASKPPARPPAGIRIPIFAGQEILTTEAADTPSLKLGPADVRILGYIGLSAIFRSASMGGGPGTSFLGIPYRNTPPGNITELRLTTQTSRLAVRIDIPFAKDRLAGYIETDFSGATPGNALVSSSSYGFRVRHAWIDYRRAKFELAGGQMFSLMTPTRADIQTWPGDALTTQAVDTNYVAGLVWDRSPGVRMVYRPNKAWNLAVAVENPEQQVGSVVRFPAALASVLSNQYNTGRGELKTPNVAGDTIFKAAWNGKSGFRTIHADAGIVLRFFRNYDPANVTQHKTATGIGGNLNITADLTRKVRLLAQGFLSSGGGRYIGGLLPDVIVRSNGDISPVKAHSWVTGLEWSATRRLSVFAYYSGLYGSRNTAIDADGSQIGFGFSGSNASRRLTHEWTSGWAQTIWNGEDAGSLQYAAQYSFLTNKPWSPGSGPGSAQAHMVLCQLRYNLP